MNQTRSSSASGASSLQSTAIETPRETPLTTPHATSLATALPALHATSLATRLAERISAIPESPLRALLKSAHGPRPFDLAGGIPDPACFPVAAFEQAAARVLKSAAQSLQYAPTEGLPELRAFIAARLTRRGLHLPVEQILITHGSQHALGALALLLTDRSRPVGLEQPAFPGAEQAFRLAEAPLLEVPRTAQGWDLEHLGGALPAALYVNPVFQNPTGLTATAASRLALATWAEQHGVYLVEDDAYAELSFEQTLERPVAADAPTRGIVVGTFSKTLAPGLRVGFIACPAPLVGPLTRLLQAMTLQPGTLAQHLVWEVLQSLDWQAHLSGLAQLLSQRGAELHKVVCDAKMSAEAPRGGFYLWARVPTAADSFAARALEHGLAVVPESAFFMRPQGSSEQHVRMSFSRFQNDARLSSLLSGLTSMA